MPDIKGIIALTYMVFAPRHAMRFTTSDQKRTVMNRDQSDERVRVNRRRYFSSKKFPAKRIFDEKYRCRFTAFHQQFGKNILDLHGRPLWHGRLGKPTRFEQSGSGLSGMCRSWQPIRWLHLHLLLRSTMSSWRSTWKSTSTTCSRSTWSAKAWTTFKVRTVHFTIWKRLNFRVGMAENHKIAGRSMPQVEKKQRELRQRVLHFLFRPRQDVQPMKVRPKNFCNNNSWTWIIAVALRGTHLILAEYDGKWARTPRKTHQNIHLFISTLYSKQSSFFKHLTKISFLLFCWNFAFCCLGT